MCADCMTSYNILLQDYELHILDCHDHDLASLLFDDFTGASMPKIVSIYPPLIN